ncbi:hypothetical protein H9I45_00165 [Polaribacter haliotis]|uniref:Uncharacterized protein n=1 Tax=Polaribacter haliotis TaxID=1888915 RepID=A0A7L8AG04_9FLAO|nr:hypothetical protein [Polaribacter haliotis]QOD60897.1 hypothetical protein H9I45_00165 [Polaribacter haliotis]
MKYAIKIHKISTVDELENSWNIEDYKELLERFDFPNAESTDIKELRELLFMAIADFETNEAAAIVLDYKLSDHLNEGQIDSISHEMLVDKISEEYPEIELHQQLFNINQLLYKAYNGKFPNTKATIVNFDITPKANADENITKEIALKCIAKSLDSHNVVIRLFGNQLNADEAFEEANDVIWELQKNDAGYRLITSEYFMSKEEFLKQEFEANIAFFEEE